MLQSILVLWETIDVSHRPIDKGWLVPNHPSTESRGPKRCVDGKSLSCVEVTSQSPGSPFPPFGTLRTALHAVNLFLLYWELVHPLNKVVGYTFITGPHSVTGTPSVGSTTYMVGAPLPRQGRHGPLIHHCIALSHPIPFQNISHLGHSRAIHKPIPSSCKVRGTGRKATCKRDSRNLGGNYTWERTRGLI
jgi:hypothetical protein